MITFLLLSSIMDGFVDTWVCSYALVLVIFSYIVYSIISIEFDLEIIDNNHSDILVILSDDLNEIIIINIEDIS